MEISTGLASAGIVGHAEIPRAGRCPAWRWRVSRYPHIIIERKDNGWAYVLRSSAATVTDAVHVDGSPLVLKFCRI